MNFIVAGLLLGLAAAQDNDWPVWFGNENTNIDELEGGSLAGVIVGFGLTGIFIIYAAARLVHDEIMRHGQFNRKVLKRENVLKDDYGKTTENI